METTLILQQTHKTDKRNSYMNLWMFDVSQLISLRRAFLSIFVIGLVMIPQAGLAEEFGQQTGKVGEADVYATVKFGLLSSDNAFKVRSNKLEARGFLVAPSVSVVANRRGSEYTASYRGGFAEYSLEELDYADHRLSGSVDAILGTRKRFSFTTDFELRHEELGTDLTRGAAGEGDDQIQVADFSVDANYTYGAPMARINVVGGLVLQNIAFQNRSDITEGRDYSEINPYGILSYRISGDTRALVELGLSNFNFENDSRDRTMLEVFSGLSFQGAGKTSGQIKVGMAANNYSDNRVENTNVFVADIGLFFSPSLSSRIEVNFIREINNEDGLDFSSEGAQTIDDTSLVRWDKSWSGFAKSSAFVEFEKQERECPTFGTQSLEYGFELSVLPRRWVEIGAGISSRDVTADECVDGVSRELEYGLTEFSAFVRIFP